MRLVLFHGRKTPDEPMDDWGFDAPIIEGATGIYVTYMCHFRVHFESKEACDAAQALTGWELWDDNCLLMRLHDDLIQTVDGYFGDWSLVPDEEVPL